MRIGALEAGGTKMVCAIVEDGRVVDRVSMPTRSPEETMPEMIDYFAAHAVEALGVGSFGPLDLDRNSPTWGYITATPKDGWRFYDLAGELQRALGVPVALIPTSTVPHWARPASAAAVALRTASTLPSVPASVWACCAAAG